MGKEKQVSRTLDKETQEEVLIAEAADVDALLAVLYPKLKHWAMSMTDQNHLDAEDLLQETAIKIFKKFDEFRGDCKRGTWAYTIMKNTRINQVNRASARLERLSESYNSTTDMVEIKALADNNENAFIYNSGKGMNGLGINPSRVLIAREEVKAMFEFAVNDKGLNRALKSGLGWSGDEIEAEEIGVPKGTIKSSMTRGKRRFLKAYEPLGT